MTQNISIHTLHTEGDYGRLVQVNYNIFISIHTLHTEGDPKINRGEIWTSISIHTLHTEGDYQQRQK